MAGLGLLLNNFSFGIEETPKEKKFSLRKVGYTTSKEGLEKYKGYTVYVENLLSQSENGFDSVYFGINNMKLDNKDELFLLLGIDGDYESDTFSVGYKVSFLGMYMKSR